jgi:hypothetical protein
MAKKQTAAKKTETAAPKMRASGATHEHQIDLLPADFMKSAGGQIKTLMAQFNNMSENNLTALQRRRKKGSGIRIYGFIDEVSDLAEANPMYAHFFEAGDLKNCVRNIEMCRNIVLELQAFARMVSNTMLVFSDCGNSMALIYYNMVKEMSRRGDPAAMEIFHALQPFFRKKKRVSAEPTVKELERDARALLKGTKEGTIVIESKSPKRTSGVRRIIDDAHKSKVMNKESTEVETEE